MFRYRNKTPTNYHMKIITEHNSFYSWNGRLYQSDVIRSCIRPKAKAIGKLVAKHIRESGEDLKINPEPYMRFLLEEPNPYMTGQMMQEKLITQLELNNNAFALIVRDDFGYAKQIYPIPCNGVNAKYTDQGELMLEFQLKNGKSFSAYYSDVIHLRQDYNDNDIFGDSPAKAIISLMEVVNATDQGVVNAIKNSNVIKWILKFNQVLKPEDITKNVKEFTKNFLSIDSETGGAAAADAKFDIQQVKNPDTFVPNAAQNKGTMERIYNFFNTNEKIVQSKYTEDEWNAYYESEIEPLATQLSGEFTRKLFSRKERGFGNRIIFECSNLQYASMSTKLGLVAMVDRGAMTPNEWRRVMNLGPIENGNKAIRRLDTAEVEGGADDEDSNQGSDSQERR